MPRTKNSQTTTRNTARHPKVIASAQSLSAFVKSICDIMRRSNCASALQYVPELTWVLFLRILDAQEEKAREEAEALGAEFQAALAGPYRWRDWAAPYSEKDDHPRTEEGKPFGWKRQDLFAAGDGRLFDFINKELLPHLHGLDLDARTGLPNPDASRKQRIFSAAGAGVKTNLLFFTRGRKTEKIWYYDLSWVKVGKKTPLTLAHFGFDQDGSVLDDARLPATLTADWATLQDDEGTPHPPFPSYARLLPHRHTPDGESRYSWTVRNKAGSFPRHWRG